MAKAKSEQTKTRVKTTKSPAKNKTISADDNSLQNLAELQLSHDELESQNQELKKYKTQLERARDQYWHLFNNAPVGYLILDRQGMIIKVNMTFVRMIAEPQEKLLGKAFRKFICDEDQNGFVAKFKSFFLQPSGKTLEVCMKNTSGATFWVMMTGTVYNDGPEGLEQVLVNIADVTDRKSLEDERKKLEERMNHFQRLESLGILAGGIAHDFNNLLTIIRGNSEISLMSKLLPVDLRKYLAEIVDATDRASKLTNQMLAYAGHGLINRKQTDVSHEINALVPLINSSIAPGVELKLDLHSDCMTECDLSQLQQVIMNTVINGSEAIEDAAGEIEVKSYLTTISSDFDESFVCVPEKLADRYVCLEIRDTGVGMSKDIVGKLFDPFFSTKFTGRGLGMASVLGIIKRHFGAISLVTSPGRGSIFKFFFPAQLTGQKDKNVIKESEDLSSFKGHALITEDEPIIRRLMENFLKNMGFEVTCVENGREGAEFLKQNPQNLVLAIIDMVMPEMDGKEFYGLLRRKFSTVPVVFCSGYSSEYVPEKIRNDVNTGFVQKPFSWKSVEKEIVRLVKR